MSLSISVSVQLTNYLCLYLYSDRRPGLALINTCGQVKENVVFSNLILVFVPSKLLSLCLFLTKVYELYHLDFI